MKFILFDILENLILQKSLAFGNIISIKLNQFNNCCLDSIKNKELVLVKYHIFLYYLFLIILTLKNLNTMI